MKTRSIQGIVATGVSIIFLGTAIQADVLRSLEEEITRLVESTRPGVVSISTKSGFLPMLDKRQAENVRESREWVDMPVQRNVGSGFIFGREGYILTTESVIEGAAEIMVKLSNDEEYEAELIGSDKEMNVAVLKVDKILDPMKLGSSDKITAGSWVIILGNSFGLFPSASFGLVNGRRNDGLIQMSANVRPGNSGGPVLDTGGRVIGVVTATISEPLRISFSGQDQKKQSSYTLIQSRVNIPYQGTSLAIPIDRLKKVAEKLIKYGSIERGWLGVIIGKLNDDLRRQWGVDHGVLVADVVDDSPAAEAGLKRRDVIVQYEDEEIHHTNQLKDLVSDTQVNQEVSLQVIRDGQPMKLKVLIKERPPFSIIGEPSGPTYPDFQLPPTGETDKDALSEQEINSRIERLEQEIERLKGQLKKRQD